MPMLNRFEEFARENDLYRPSERVLLAVSGGMDSAVMAHLAHRAGWRIALAHCNFQLRGEASDEDAAWVAALARRYEAPFFLARFDTREEAARRGVSIQMAARELRYEWLEIQRQGLGYDRIATAHQLDDSIETVLYNFVKGTGLRGLHGIPVKRDRIVRPLLFAAREEIADYCQKHSLDYREDASNKEERYARNRLRLRIMPVLRALNPAFSRTAAENSRRLREAEYLYDLALKQLRGDILSQDGPRHYLDVERLLHHFPAAATILYELLRPFNFHARQVKQMLDSLSRQPGALFYSHTHQLLIDRETIIIEPRISTWESAVFGIDPQAESVFLPDGQLSVAWKEGRPKELTHSPLRVALDADALRLPLRLRHWRPGDYFYPYGMGGKRQKLQDFFTNNKIPRLDKNRIWLLETDDHRICWVVGRRIDERFKITPQTERHVVLTFSPY